MRFSVDRWIEPDGEAGASMTYVQANANLSPGEAPQTAESWSQMQAAESDILNAAQNGVSSDPNEQGKLAFSIAMGIAAYAAPPFAALMAGLYALAQAIAPELYDIGLLDRPHCTRTGPLATPQDWPVPVQTKAPGIPATLWLAVADQMTRQANCQSYIPSALLYSAFQGIWNNAHAPTANFAMAIVDYGGPIIGESVQEALPFFGMPWEESLWRYTPMTTSDQLTMRYYMQNGGTDGRGALKEIDFNMGPVLPGHGTGPTTPAPPSSTAYRGTLVSSVAGASTSSAKGGSGVATAAVVGAGALAVVALAKPALFKSWLRRAGVRL